MVPRTDAGDGARDEKHGDPGPAGAADLPLALRLQSGADDGGADADDEAGSERAVRRRPEIGNTVPALRGPTYDYPRGTGSFRRTGGMRPCRKGTTIWFQRWMKPI